MAPMICLVVAFLIFRSLGFFVPWLADVQHALRAALGAKFLLTAFRPLGRRRPDLIRMVPRGVGNAGLSNLPPIMQCNLETGRDKRNRPTMGCASDRPQSRKEDAVLLARSARQPLS
jgi:hypothetical protein